MGSVNKTVQAYAASAGAPQGYSVWKDIIYLLVKIGAIILIFVVLFTFMFGLMRYDDPSMTPAIKDGDLVIYYRDNDSGYKPRDTVALEIGGQKQIRRVVATAGDLVDITEAGLLINGALQQESEIYECTQRYQDGVELPLIVPEGQVFLMGDCRENCTDSRIYGPVSIKDTKGKVMTVIRRRSI